MPINKQKDTGCFECQAYPLCVIVKEIEKLPAGPLGCCGIRINDIIEVVGRNCTARILLKDSHLND